MENKIYLFRNRCEYFKVLTKDDVINIIGEFGSLKDTLKSSWQSNKDNYIIKISTEKENSLWQIFSIYHIPTTNDYLQTEFKDEREYQSFLNILKNRSNHNFNTSITSNDTILTLSTCYNDSEKMVVHAKLIKKQKKY